MEKNIKIMQKTIIFLLFIFMLFSLISCKSEVKEVKEPDFSDNTDSESSISSNSSTFNDVETDYGIYKFQKDYLTPEEEQSFSKLCDDAIIDVKDYLGEKYIKNDKKITIYIEAGDDYASETSELGWIQLYGVKEHEAEYVHEIVHAISGFKDPLFIDEGFATYLDYKYTKWKNPPHYNEDINKLAHKYIFIDEKTHLTRLSDENLRAQDRSLSYIVAASLADYIEKEKGKDALLRLHDNFDDANEILGEDFLDFKNKWLEYLEENY